MPKEAVPYLSIVIPAYNEERRIRPTLVEVLAYCEAQAYSTEVLVVDDGSGDDTVLVVQELMGQHSNLHLINNARNQGKGAVVRQGMLAAKGEMRLFMDADSSVSIDQVVNLLDKSQDADVIIGSRYLNHKSIQGKRPISRRILSRGSNVLIQALVLPGIRDTQCGFKMMHAKSADIIFSRMTQGGWLFDVEMLVIAQELGLRIIEVPIHWVEAANSTLRAGRAMATSLRELQRIRQQRRRGYYRDKEL
jgi:dolichyl-phosphate beta-glucosyltransferase